MPRQFQFGLQGMFIATLLTGLVLTLATLTPPASFIIVYAICAVAAAQAGSQSVWRAVICGSLGGLAGFYLVYLVQFLQGGIDAFDHTYLHVQGMFCCFPLGAQLGFAIGYFAQERRFQRRLKAKTEELKQETAEFQRQHPPISDDADQQRSMPP